MTSDIHPFGALGLSPAVVSAVESLGFSEPTPIQRSSIPVVLNGSDIIGKAQTGSGKTAAFALPLLDRLDRSAKGVQALILAPTRELACQVAEAIRTFAGGMPWVKLAVLYGGARYDRQLKELRDSPQIVVATPGRLSDHQRRGTVNLDRVRMVVLDEADEMLAMGFRDDVEAILGQTSGKRQTLLFSATMPPIIRDLAQRFLREPVDVSIASTSAAAPAIDQRFWIVQGMTKVEALERIVTGIDFSAMVVFVRTKAATIEVVDALMQRGHDAVALNGDMRQAERERVVEDLKVGKRRLLVATDVAARGLDLSIVSHVINFDVPGDIEAYIHRIGRTGRAGREGTAIAFISPREKFRLRALERASNGKISPFEIPSIFGIRSVRIERFRAAILKKAQEPVVANYEEIINGIVEEGVLTPIQIAAAVSALLHQDNPIMPVRRAPERRAKVEATDELSAPKESGSRLGEARRRERAAPSEDEARPVVARPRVVEAEQKQDGATDSGSQVLCELNGGRADGLTVETILSAVADAVGIPGRLLGAIRLLDDRATISIPAEVIEGARKKLRRLWVVDRRFRVTPLEEVARPREKRVRSEPRVTTRREPIRREGVRAVSRTPRRVDADSRAPRRNDADSRPPRRADSDTRPPRRIDADSRAPRRTDTERRGRSSEGVARGPSRRREDVRAGQGPSRRREDVRPAARRSNRVSQDAPRAPRARRTPAR